MGCLLLESGVFKVTHPKLVFKVFRMLTSPGASCLERRWMNERLPVPQQERCDSCITACVVQPLRQSCLQRSVCPSSAKTVNRTHCSTRHFSQVAAAARVLRKLRDAQTPAPPSALCPSQLSEILKCALKAMGTRHREGFARTD